MSAESALLGTPRIFTFDGADYEVKLVGRSVKAAYEQHLVARAVEKLDKSRGKMKLTQKQYRDELRLIGEREDRGEFAFNANLATIQTTWGQETLLKLIMPSCPKDVLERILEEKSDEVLWLIDRVLSESMPMSVKKAQEVEQRGPFGETEAEPLPTSTPS